MWECGSLLSYDPREHVQSGRPYPASAARGGKLWETGIEQDKATARNQEIAPSSVEYKGGGNQKEKLLGTRKEETVRRVKWVRAEGLTDADCSVRTAASGKHSTVRKEQGAEAERIFLLLLGVVGR